MNRPSHADYVAGCDEDQLANLIEQAKSRIEKLRSSGWTHLWVVNVNWGNVAWFPQEDYQAAVDFASEAFKNAAIKCPNKGIGVELSLERYRPEEIEGLLARTQKEKPPCPKS